MHALAELGDQLIELLGPSGGGGHETARFEGGAYEGAAETARRTCDEPNLSFLCHAISKTLFS
ncbi:hypothetical protein GCM10009617_25840 [Leifsonia poae]|uniref:Uncharacterized protein n=1 Tax=Leifsonia poae TaxID=110933 RepID=A0A9W6HB10_9MICO|nr:hypothetical protein GCM10017584_28000 [Leifsonia poae]